MNDEEHKFEAPQPPREKHESKKSEKSCETSDSNKKSKSSSSSSSNHHSSSSSHNHHSSSSKHHTKNHLSSTNNHQSSNHHSSSSSNHHHHHSEHKEKEHKKSHDSKLAENKHHKSSSSSHKTSNSHKRSREDAESKENEMKAKKMKSDSEKSDKKSNSSNDVKESTSTSNGTSSKSKKKDHKSPSKRKHSNDDVQEFDGTTGMGFAEALAAFDMPTSSSSSKRQKQELADKMIPVKSSSSSSSSSKSKSSSSSSSSSTHKNDKDKNKSSKSTSPRPSTSKTTTNFTQPPKLLTQKPKLDLLPDIVNELPTDVSIPDYRPLPLNTAMKDYINSNASAYGSMQSRHNRIQTESELLTDSISSQKSRTRVYSGNTRARAEIPKLYDSCLRVVTENLDYVETTGGIPFDIIRPALEKAKPEQLANIEYYNPYLLEESDILWKPHCQRKWKNRQPDEMESWRDMYDRCTRDEAEKLSRLTQNIKQSQEKTSNGIQKTKMAFVDTMVKAPRGIVRKQEQFGTSRKVVVSPAARTEGLKNLQPNLAAAGDVRLRVAAGLRDDAQHSKLTFILVLILDF